MSSRRLLLQAPLRILNIAGAHPQNQNLFSIIRMLLCELTITFTGFEMLLDCIFNWKGLGSLQNVAVFLGTYQVLFKHNVMVLSRKRLIKVLDNMEMFLPTHNCSETLQKEIETLFTFVKKSVNFVVMVFLFFAALYLSVPFLSNKRNLPFSTYHPKDLELSPDYEFMLFMQYAFFFATGPVFLGFDVFLISLIVIITCELKILKSTFLEVKYDERDVSKIMNRLNRLVDHHNLILDCIKDLNNIYQILFLNIFLINMLSICVGLLCAVASGYPPEMHLISTYASYVFLYIGQLFFYCMAGSYLITESEDVANAAYNSNWWECKTTEVRKPLILVIQRANKTEKLTAGGVFTLNMQNFTMVLRTAWSFFTIMQTTYSK